MAFKAFKFGEYMLMEKIATGGMAEVYHAIIKGASGFEKHFAVKKILPHYSKNENFIRMFEAEARINSHLCHANIAQVYNFQYINDDYILVMEYIRGKTLKQLYRQATASGQTLPIEACLYIVNEILKGLDYAHTKKNDIDGEPLNIIHRDISPQNIILSYEGEVKIVDFGIAKTREHFEETQTGYLKGKFSYISPEQLKGGQFDARVDIFSAGIMLFEILTGSRLFKTDTELLTLTLVAECSVPSPRNINPLISPELEQIVLKSLSKEPDKRYQTANEMRMDLMNYFIKYYPGFTQKHLSITLTDLFKKEINEERQNYLTAYQKSSIIETNETCDNEEMELDTGNENQEDELLNLLHEIKNTEQFKKSTLKQGRNIDSQLEQVFPVRKSERKMLKVTLFFMSLLFLLSITPDLLPRLTSVLKDKAITLVHLMPKDTLLRHMNYSDDKRGFPLQSKTTRPLNKKLTKVQKKQLTQTKKKKPGFSSKTKIAQRFKIKNTSVYVSW